MSRRFFIIGLVVGALVASLAVSTYIVFTSLWYFEALLPVGYEPDMVVGFTSARHIAPYRTLATQHLIEPDNQSLVPLFNRFLLARNENGEVIVGLPRLRSQRHIISLLHQQGWNTERIGLLVYATRMSDDISSSHASYVQAFTTAIMQYKRSGGVRNPQAIIELTPASHAIVDRRYTVIVFSDREGLISEIYVGESRPPIGLYDAFNVLPEDPTRSLLSIHVPGVLVRLVPQLVEEQLDRYIAAELGFVRLRTGYINSLKNQTRLLIQKNAEGIVIGAEGDGKSFVAEVESWLQSELAYHNPVRQAFRLPDGTLGYEYVPGEQVVKYEAEYGDTNCRTAVNNNVKVWVCSRDDRAAIGTNYELARKFVEPLQQITMPWHVVLPENELSGTPLGDYMQQLMAMYSDGKALIRIIDK